MAQVSGSAIIAGYRWEQQFQLVGSGFFPVGCTLVGQVRKTPADAAILATLRTSDGSLVRMDDNTVKVIIAGTLSVDWVNSVCFDLVRTDIVPNTHWGIIAQIKVLAPITRGLP